MTAYFTDAIDVVADVCRQTAGLRLVVLDGAETRGYDDRSVSFLGQMNHHTGPGRWTPMTNFILWGHKWSPLANGMTSNPYETGGEVIVQIVACGRANHAGEGAWPPDVPTNRGNEFLWGWEHHHPGDSSPWHPLHREGILRLNVGLNLAFGWKAHNVPDHKDYAPGRKIDRAGEDGDWWRRQVHARMDVGTISGHAPPKERVVSRGRIAGEDRFETAAEMMRKAYPNRRGGTVYVVTTESSEERLSAHMDGPVALVTREGVPVATRRYLAEVGPDRVEALGGTSTVPGGVLRECQSIAEQA